MIQKTVYVASDNVFCLKSGRWELSFALFPHWSSVDAKRIWLERGYKIDVLSPGGLGSIWVTKEQMAMILV